MYLLDFIVRKNWGIIMKRDLHFINYFEEPDFRRWIIKGSMRAQRRKIVILGPSQRNPHSPLFFQKKEDFPFPIADLLKLFFNIITLLGKRGII